MSVTATTNKVQYAAAGTTGPFAFNYPVRDQTELDVYVTVDATGVQTLQTITTHYTVTVNDDYSGASVTFVSSVAAGNTITINRNPALTNENTYNIYDGTFPTVIEEDIDRTSMQDQYLQEQITRSLKAQISDDLDATLPPLVGNDGKYIQIVDDEDGTFSLTLSESTLTDSVTNAGPETDNTVARFDGITGQVIQGSGVVIDDSDNITGVTSIDIGGTIAVTGVLDEDTMSSDSAVKLATQQSIKAYVDSQVGGAGDVTGPASSTDNAVVRFDLTTGKLLQNSSCTIDDSDNMIVGGTLTVDGDHIYTGAASILDNVWGPDREAHLEVAASTSGHGRIAIQGGSFSGYAPAALILIDSQSTTNKRAWALSAGFPSTRDMFGISLSNDNGTSPTVYFKIDVSGTPTTTIASNTVVSGTTDFDGTCTVSGQLRIDSATGTFWSPAGTDSGNADNFVIGPNVLAPNENGMTIIGTTTNKANIFFGDSVDSTLGRVVYDNSADSLAFWSNGTLALTIDSSQHVTLPTGDLTLTSGDITVTTGDITLTAGKMGIDGAAVSASYSLNAAGDINLQRAANTRLRIQHTSGATTQLYSTGSIGYVGTASAHAFSIYANNAAALTCDTSQNVSIPTGHLTITAGDLIISTTGSPASADAGTAGTIAWDASYLYVCTASGAWKRVALTGGY